MFSLNNINDIKIYFLKQSNEFIEYIYNTYTFMIVTIKEIYQLYLHDYFNPFIARIKIELNDIFSIIGLLKNSLSETTQNIIGVGLIIVILLFLLSIFGSYSKKEKTRIKKFNQTSKKRVVSKSNLSTNAQTNREQLMELEIKLLELQYQFNKGEISQKDYLKLSLKYGEKANKL